MGYEIVWDGDRFRILGSIEGFGRLFSNDEDFSISIRIRRPNVVDETLVKDLPRTIGRSFGNFSRSAVIEDMIQWLNDTNKISSKVRPR